MMRKISCKILLISLLISGIIGVAEATETITIAAIFAKTGIAANDNAPLFQSLRLTSIPSNFLLDPDGKVLAKNLHSDELKTFVENFMER